MRGKKSVFGAGGIVTSIIGAILAWNPRKAGKLARPVWRNRGKDVTLTFSLWVGLWLLNRLCKHLPANRFFFSSFLLTDSLRWCRPTTHYTNIISSCLVMGCATGKTWLDLGSAPLQPLNHIILLPFCLSQNVPVPASYILLWGQWCDICIQVC